MIYSQGRIWLEYSQTGKTQRGGMYGSEAQIRSKETQSVRRQLQKWNVATCIYKVDKCKKAKSVFCWNMLIMLRPQHLQNI